MVHHQRSEDRRRVNTVEVEAEVGVLARREHPRQLVLALVDSRSEVQRLSCERTVDAGSQRDMIEGQRPVAVSRRSQTSAPTDAGAVRLKEVLGLGMSVQELPLLLVDIDHRAHVGLYLPMVEVVNPGVTVALEAT